MNITMLSLGSRGDTQPQIMLGNALVKAGYNVTMCAPREFEELVQSYGLVYHDIGFSFKTLMASDDVQSVVESGGNIIRDAMQFIRALKPMRKTVFQNGMAASEGADALIMSMGVGNPGVDVAAERGIPLFLSLPVQFFCKTGEWPHFGFPNLGGKFYNRLTHTLVEELLALVILNHHRMRRMNTPYIYAISPSILPRPSDWDDNMHLTGFWTVKKPTTWEPPQDLVDFLAAGPPPVFISFGSMIEKNPQEIAEILHDTLALTQQRAVLVGGWTDISIFETSDDVFKIQECPYDWLLPQMAVIVHHGGAGTTASAMHAGVPEVVVPFLGDQPYWGQRVEALGIGPAAIPRKKLTAEKLAAAIQTALHDEGMRERAQALATQLKTEDGLSRAVAVVQKTLEERHIARSVNVSGD